VKIETFQYLYTYVNITYDIQVDDLDFQSEYMLELSWIDLKLQKITMTSVNENFLAKFVLSTRQRTLWNWSSLRLAT